MGHWWAIIPLLPGLMIACSFIKRSAEGPSWEDPVGSDGIAMIREVIRKVKLDDPVQGGWYVPKMNMVRYGVMLAV